MPETTSARRVAAAFVIRCIAGVPDNQIGTGRGRFLAWKGGYFMPCCRLECARHYPSNKIARVVAARAAQAFPGASFEVEEVQEKAQ